MKADLISILNKKYQVYIILNKLLSDLQLKLRQLQTLSKTMIQLQSETSRLEFILSQQKFRRKNQKEQNKDSDQKKYDTFSTQNKKLLKKTDESEDKDSPEKKTKSERSYLFIKKY